MTKMTKKVALEIAMNAISAAAVKEYHMAGSEDVFKAEDAVAKLADMIKQLDARASAEKKPTKTQVENEGVKAHMLDVLATVGKPVTISELMAVDATLGAMTNQKVAALIRQLVKAGQVERTEEKHKAYFAVTGEG